MAKSEQETNPLWAQKSQREAEADPTYLQANSILMRRLFYNVDFIVRH